MKTADTKTQATTARQNKPFFQRKSKQSFLGNNSAAGTFFTGSSPSSPAIQAKLSIGQPGDKYEQEANAMADNVVQRQVNSKQVQAKPLATSISPLVLPKCEDCADKEKLAKKEETTFEPNEEEIQRKCEDCEAEEKLQKKESSSSQTKASPAIESSLNASKDSGSPLPAPSRNKMESAFGADFSNVKIHTDATAVQKSKGLQAQAFTHGQDIYFNSGNYNDSAQGQHLLAHELTHVVQQHGNGPALQQQSATATPSTPPPPQICGPDVTTEVTQVWSSIQNDFRGWSTDDKMAACIYLISPYVPEAGTNPRSAGGSALFGGFLSEPIVALLERIMNNPVLSMYVNLTNTQWQLNRDAFDTIGLFVLSADWTLQVPGCGTPSCAGLSSDNLPRGHSDPCESPDLCAFAVQMNSNCWLSGTVNYGTYGIMMKEAYTWCHSQQSRLLNLLPGFLLRSLGDFNVALALLRAEMSDKEIGAAIMTPLFSLPSVVAYVGGYKLWDMENPTDPFKWAVTAYRSGPGVVPPGSNRPDCSPACGSLDPSIFSDWDYVWEPVKHRS